MSNQNPITPSDQKPHWKVTNSKQFEDNFPTDSVMKPVEDTTQSPYNAQMASLKIKAR